MPTPPPLRPPTLHLVIDTDTRPARYGVMASLLAQSLRDGIPAVSGATSAASSNVAFGHLPFHFDTARFADAVQHVALSGDLLPSGLLWYERLTGRPAPQPRLLNAWLADWFDADRGIAPKDSLFDNGVLAIHPDVTAIPESLPHLIDQARAAMQRLNGGGGVQCYRVIEMRHGDDASWALVAVNPADAVAFETTDTLARPASIDSEASRLTLRAKQDRYGRWERVLPVPPASAAKHAIPKTIRIALVGTEAEQRGGYPGTLAALGDAADEMGVLLDVCFVSPYDAVTLVTALHDVATQTLSDVHGITLPSTRDDAAFARSRVRGTARPLCGIVLPGGADMQRVAGQIAAAAYGWEHRLPTLGLCLGMQTMATAALQRATRRLDMTLLELAPDTEVPSFVRNADAGHRLGLHPIVATNGNADRAERDGGIEGHAHVDSRLLPQIAIGTAMRCNHRFRLNPALYPALTAASIDIIAWDLSGTIVDGIAAMPGANHPFYAGAQGHPELMSMPGQAHPLILSWLRAVAAIADAE